MKSKKIVCFGEILWDLFPNGKRLGGAPYNVANSLKSLETDLNYLSEEAKSSLEKFKKLEKHQEEEFEVYLDKFVNDI